MAARPSITYWNRVEPSPRSDSLQRGLEAAVRDPLWFLARQWQVGEFQGEDAASPAFASFAVRVAPLDGWRPGDAGDRRDAGDGGTGAGALRPYDGSAALEPLSQNEATTPDLRTAVELGQALAARLVDEGAADAVVEAFRSAFPVPAPSDLSPAERRDPASLRLARVCGGRAIHGIDALDAARRSAPALPEDLDLPAGGDGPATAALSWLVGWVDRTLGPLGLGDAEGWRPERLEYALEVAGTTPDGERVALRAETGPFGDLDWYAFDESERATPAPPTSPIGPRPRAEQETVRTSVLPAAVSFSGMPNPRWWQFEDARFNWAAVDTDRRELAKVLVMDFMLIQGNDWFMVPFGQDVGTMVQVDQLLVRDVFGDWTAVRRADAEPGTGRARWTMFSIASDTTKTGLTDYFLLPPGALRTTLDGPDLEEVRFVRDEQANMVWAIETTTQDGAGRARPGRERAIDVPNETATAPPGAPVAPLRYRLQTTVPINWIPFVPVQIDATRRAVALERAAMQRFLDGELQAVAPAGRVLQPTNLADPDIYRLDEEEVARTGMRILRADRRTRWIDGSTHLWTSRRTRAGMGEATSGLRYDVAEPTDTASRNP